MGFLRKLTGGTDTKLLETGVLARGEILGVSPSGTTIQAGGGMVERKCEFTLKVMADLQPAFQASVSQRVPEVYLPQLMGGGAVVAVRVDPDDPTNVAIDFASEAPKVRLPQSTGPGSAADILATGTPVKVVLVQNQPIGVANFQGYDVHALTLTVVADGQAPYQVQVGNAIPPEALPLVYPGSHLHAKRGAGPNDLVVDWQAGPAPA